MSFKQLFFQSALILFIIGFSSCEKDGDIKESEQTKLHKETTKNTNAKLGSENTIEFAFHFDSEIPIEKTLSILENFLLKKNLALKIQDVANSDEGIFFQFIYDQENDQFEELNTKIDIITNLDTPVANHLITTENTEWDTHIYENEIRGITTLLVITIVHINTY